MTRGILEIPPGEPGHAGLDVFPTPGARVAKEAKRHWQSSRQPGAACALGTPDREIGLIRAGGGRKGRATCSGVFCPGSVCPVCSGSGKAAMVVLVGADNPDEALDVDHVPGIEIGDRLPCPVGEVKKRAVDDGKKAGLVGGRKRMPHAHRELPGHLRLEEHVRFGPPEERQVGRDRPVRAAMGLGTASSLHRAASVGSVANVAAAWMKASAPGPRSTSRTRIASKCKSRLVPVKAARTGSERPPSASACSNGACVTSRFLAAILSRSWSAKQVDWKPFGKNCRKRLQAPS